MMGTAAQKEVQQKCRDRYKRDKLPHVANLRSAFTTWILATPRREGKLIHARPGKLQSHEWLRIASPRAGTHSIFSAWARSDSSGSAEHTQ